MSKIDDMIRDALKCEEHETLRNDGELSFFALGLRQFTGVNGWVTWLTMIIQAIFFFAGVFCAIRFFMAAEPLSAIKWGVSGAVALIGGLQIKLSLAPQMQADRVIREIRRLELRLSAPKA